MSFDTTNRQCPECKVTYDARFGHSCPVIGIEQYHPTRRDYFAAAALQGAVMRNGITTVMSDHTNSEKVDTIWTRILWLRLSFGFLGQLKKGERMSIKCDTCGSVPCQMPAVCLAYRHFMEVQPNPIDAPKLNKYMTDHTGRVVCICPKCSEQWVMDKDLRASRT